MELKYWGIRMKFNGKPFEKRAWDRNVIGIAYGAWSAEDIEEAINRGSDKAGAEFLNNVRRKKSSRGV